MEDFTKNYEEYQQKYGKECQAELKADKDFKVDVTPEQAVIILQPIHAPENFYCDGEISSEQAMSNWKNKLKNTGLNPTYVNEITKYILG